MTFEEVWQSRLNSRLYLDWWETTPPHTQYVSSPIVNRDIDICFSDAYYTNPEDYDWKFSKYLRICYCDGATMLSRYGINVSSFDMFPYVIISTDEITWTIMGIDETFAVNRFKVIGRLLKFYPNVSKDTAYDYFDAIAVSFGFDDADGYFKTTMRSTFECIFYQFDCEKNVVDKESSLSLYYVGAGQLTEECDIVNPSILIQTDTSDYPDTPVFNPTYVYIRQFKRYYYINRIINVRNNIWRIDCHVDVLYTYESDILEQNAYIIRNESITPRADLIDDRIAYDDIPKVVYKTITDITTPSPDTNATFSFADVTDGYKFILHTQNNVTWIFTPNDITAPNANLPDVPNLGHQNGSIYLLNSSAMANVYTANMNNDNGASYIISMMYFPIDLHSLYGFTSAPTTKIYSGNYILDTDGGVMSWYSTPHSSGYEPVGYHIENSNTPYLIIADFKFDAEPFSLVTYQDFGNWINASSKVHYELYLPFVGYTEIKYKDVVGSRIQIMYSIDFDSGMGLCMVYNYTKQYVIYTTQCQIGYQIPINTSNAHEITIQKQNNMTNLMLSLVASVVTIGIGGLAGGLATTASSAVITGAGALVTGGKQSTSAIASFINQNNLLFERASVTFGGTDGLFYLPVTKPHWKVTYNDIIESQLSDYLPLNGYPVNQTYDLDDITGYTEVGIIHYTPSGQTWITSPEIDEIELLAKNGIIL